MHENVSESIDDVVAASQRAQPRMLSACRDLTITGDTIPVRAMVDCPEAEIATTSLRVEVT